MALEGSGGQSEGRYVHANGTDIHYVEAGEGEPLLLLHAGLVSTNPIWADHPAGWVSHMDTFAEHFRVIAPDARGHGRTANPGGGPIPFTQLADDIVALIDARRRLVAYITGVKDGKTVTRWATGEVTEAPREGPKADDRAGRSATRPSRRPTELAKTASARVLRRTKAHRKTPGG